MDGGGGGDESPSELDFPAGTDGGLAGALYERMSPVDCWADGGSVLSDGLASVGAAPDGAGQGCGLSWALAMFGEDWFGKDVIQYAENLGQHPAACLDVKMQVGGGAAPTSEVVRNQQDAGRTVGFPSNRLSFSTRVVFNGGGKGTKGFFIKKKQKRSFPFVQFRV